MVSCVPRRLFCVLVALALEVIAGRVHKRDDDMTVTAPLAIDASGKYIVAVNMSSGVDTQRFGLAISTSTGYTMVAGVGCDSCDGVPSYNVSESGTAEPWTEPPSIVILNNSVTGSAYKEDCGMKTINGGVWKYPNQTVIVSNASNPMFSSGVSGVVGLGTNMNQGNFSDTIFGNYLSQQGESSDSFQLGMAINAPDNSSTNGGVLHLLAADSSAYTGNVSYKGVQDISSSANNAVNVTGISSDWMVQLDGWSCTSGTGRISNTQGGLCTVDPFYPNVYLPFDSASEIYYSISGAAQQSNSAATSESQTWSVPCDTKMSFTAVFGSESFSVDQSVLVINQGGGVCVGAIKGWTNPSYTGYVFGAKFLGEVYLIFDVYNPGSGSPNTIGFAHRSSSKSVPVGAVVGGTVGGVAFGVLVCVAAFFVHRRIRKRRNYVAIASEIDPYMCLATPGTVVKDHHDSSVFARQQLNPMLPPTPYLPEPVSTTSFLSYVTGPSHPSSPVMSVQRASTADETLVVQSAINPSPPPQANHLAAHYPVTPAGLGTVNETHVHVNSDHPSAYPFGVTPSPPPQYISQAIQPTRSQKT